MRRLPPPEGRGIFVPTPRGAGETLDSPPPASGPDQTLDRATTNRGELLLGRVVGISPAGQLRLADPQFEGDVKLPITALDTVTFAPAKAPPAAGRDTVTISNGDTICGEVTAITADAVTVNSDCAGPVKVRRNVVNAISFGKAGTVLIDSDFTRTMAPWKPHAGAWRLADGRLVCDTAGAWSSVAAPLEQSGPVTMEAVFETVGGRLDNVALYVYASPFAGGDWMTRVGGQIEGGNALLVGMRDNAQRRLLEAPLAPVQGPEHVLRVAYEPDSKKLALWLDGEMLRQCEVPEGPGAGKSIVLFTRFPCKVKRVRVTARPGPLGIAGPGKPDADVVQFVNGDKVVARSLALADGAITVQTAHGELKNAVEKVAVIQFGTNGVETPPRRHGDVTVQTRTGRLTLRLESLTADALTGTSEYLGKVAVNRSAIRSVRFNVAVDGKLYAFNGPAAMSEFTVTGKARIAAGGGLELGDKDAFAKMARSFAVSKQRFAYPLRAEFKVSCFADGVMDIYPAVFAAAEGQGLALFLGAEQNTASWATAFGDRRNVLHTAILADKVYTIVLTVDAERKATASIDGKTVLETVLNKSANLEGPIVLSGGLGHVLYRSVEVWARKVSD